MKTFTVDNIMDLNPCPEYPRSRVAALFAGRRRLSLRQILALRIPLQDRVWVAVRLLPPREARLFACDCAEHVLPVFERAFPADGRPRRAIEVARRYARGEAREEELEAAQKDAAQAVRSASAPWSAYWSAYGAYGAAGAAADAAHWSAWHAAGAAGAAAGAAEREWQVERLRVYTGMDIEVRVSCDVNMDDMDLEDSEFDQMNLHGWSG